MPRTVPDLVLSRRDALIAGSSLAASIASPALAQDTADDQPSVQAETDTMADAQDPKALIAQLNGAFEEFKNKNDERLKQIEAGSEDAVTKDEIADPAAWVERVVTPRELPA